MLPFSSPDHSPLRDCLRTLRKELELLCTVLKDCGELDWWSGDLGSAPGSAEQCSVILDNFLLICLWDGAVMSVLWGLSIKPSISAHLFSRIYSFFGLCLFSSESLSSRNSYLPILFARCSGNMVRFGILREICGFLFWSWHMEFGLSKVTVVPSGILNTKSQGERPS